MRAVAASNLPTTPKRPSPEPIIRVWRWRIGLSREGLAQALSVILSIVSRWEYGHLKPRRKHEGTTRVCRICKRRKPLAAFWRQAASIDGRDTSCGDCRESYRRRWIAQNRAAYNARRQTWREEHRDRLRAYNREYQRRRRALMQAGEWKARR